ncbi:MAG: deoxynucleoside kinase [Anaeromyxobacteraceae bacterium]
MEKSRYIAIEGPIGVGKTTLATVMADRLGGRVVLEAVEENPFLPGFYQDRKKHAFQAQIFFLLSRFQQQQELFQQDLFSQVTIADYLFAKDRIFASLTLDPNELALYERIWQVLGARVVKPDLVVYLQARPDVLAARIRKRGRDFERSVSGEYLEQVSRAYGDFFFHYEDTPLLVVNTSDIDLADEGDLEALLREIRRHRRGRLHFSLTHGK